MKVAAVLFLGIVCLNVFVEQTLAMNTNRLKAKGSVKKDGDNYELEFSFKHDLSLPYGTAELCSSPSNIASDGLPYLATRYFPYKLSKTVTKRTGFHTVGLDWNPCGHPPADVFTKPHYDIHFYMISDEYRSGMTCDLIPNAPVCNPGAQSSDAGLKFFKYVPTGTGGHLTNMPEGYEVSSLFIYHIVIFQKFIF
uniref:DUF1996 domain-containing protein n=1 Tax=Aplanochytrium stocchinoi TaxID=215587 RepID=A0A7S3LPR5_9STRA